MNSGTVKIDGYYLTFSPDEIRGVNSFLRDNGYPQDGKGLHKLILDVIQEADPNAGLNEADNRSENLTSIIEEYVRNNPEQVRRVINGGKFFFDIIKKGRKH